MKKLLSLIILFISHGLLGMESETRVTADNQTITHSTSDTGESYHQFGPSRFDTSYLATKYSNQQYIAEKTDRHGLTDTTTTLKNPLREFCRLRILFGQSNPTD